ncbi:MAG: hypothetical protein KN64_02155 [Sulfurovum sp. AS07-7]|nr:MAG: hypothetical protein KN64_02155 [Sulfurovum sp. AS07-7]
MLFAQHRTGLFVAFAPLVFEIGNQSSIVLFGSFIVADVGVVGGIGALVGGIDIVNGQRRLIGRNGSSGWSSGSLVQMGGSRKRLNGCHLKALSCTFEGSTYDGSPLFLTLFVANAPCKFEESRKIILSFCPAKPYTGGFKCFKLSLIWEDSFDKFDEVTV